MPKLKVVKIQFKKSFYNRLSQHLSYLSEHSPKAERLFKSGLFSEISKIHEHPYKNRKSIFFNDTEIRDLVFKKHVIVYKIESDRIIVFGFLKHQQNPTD